MKQITVISGKGGTGKTVLTASFAALAKKACIVDCDVDAADLYLLLKPEISETHEFKSGRTAHIDPAACTKCGECIEVCRFHAINDDCEVIPISCEGCAVCHYVCPANAITMEENTAGKWYVSSTEYGPFVHARLGIAEENSGKLVARIRQVAKDIAVKNNLDYIIIDGPPGIGCPVIASLTGTDLALIITEPTISGIHDMERVMDLADHFAVPVKVIINKHDINPENTLAIEKMCHKRNVEMLGRLPFSTEIVQSIRKGIPIVAYCRDRIGGEIIGLWNKLAASWPERSKNADS